VFQNIHCFSSKWVEELRMKIEENKKKLKETNCESNHKCGEMQI